MHHIKRLVAIATLLIIVGIPTSNIAAQDVICFDLSAEDCKIITEADANNTKLASFNYDFEMSAKYASPGVSGTATSKGKGLYSRDPSTPIDPDDPLSVYTDMKMTLDATSTSTLRSRTGSPLNQRTTINIILVDGVIYSKTSQTKQWIGIRLEDAASADQPNPGVEFMQDPEIVEAMAAIPKIKGFVKIEKSKNAPIIDGQRQIEFVYTFDIQTLLKAKEIIPIYKKLAEIGGGPVADMSDTEVAAAASQVARMMRGTTVIVTRWIGSKDKLNHGLSIDIVFKLDGGGVQFSVNQNLTLTANVRFVFKVTKIGKPVKVVAPRNAEIVEP